MHKVSYQVKMKLEVFRTLITAFCLLISYQGIEGACEADETRVSSYPDNIFPYLHTVEFQTTFQSAPVISYGIISFDLNFQENPRAKVEKYSSNTTHIVFRLSTWGDTKLYELGISWIACD